MDGGTAGLWPNEPRVLADEPTALLGYTDIY